MTYKNRFRIIGDGFFIHSFFKSPMKNYFLIIGFFAAACSSPEPSNKENSSDAFTPIVPVMEEGIPETFEYEAGDTTYLMQKYFICFLKSGSNRDQSEAETAEIQKQHLAHLSWLAEQNYISMAGPFGDDGQIKGITIFHTATLEKAKELAEMDPAVKAGRLVVELDS